MLDTGRITGQHAARVNSVPEPPTETRTETADSRATRAQRRRRIP
ncbi:MULTISPECIES: hypothetical protein [unclassified Streptomyces]